MEVWTEEDSKGNVVSYKQYNGRKFHPEMEGDIAVTLGNISSLHFREDDVLVCSYPKSGCHWLYNTIYMLRQKTLRYYGSPFLLEFDDLSQISAPRSGQTYATHLSYKFIPERAKQGKVKIVNNLRNPKDVLCSMYEYQSRLTNRLYNGSFDGLLCYFLADAIPTCGASWFTHVQEWEIAKKTNPNLKVLSLRYEDLKQDLFSNIRKITNFLELDHDDTFLRELEQTLSIDNLRREHQTQRGHRERYSTWIKDGRLPIYRKGIIGDWKHRFTVNQNELFDAVYKEKKAAMSIDLDLVFE